MLFTIEIVLKGRKVDILDFYSKFITYERLSEYNMYDSKNSCEVEIDGKQVPGACVIINATGEVDIDAFIDYVSQLSFSYNVILELNLVSIVEEFSSDFFEYPLYKVNILYGEVVERIDDAFTVYKTSYLSTLSSQELKEIGVNEICDEELMIVYKK